MAMNLFIFSGQGTQYFQMGMELYDSNDIYRKQMDDLNQIAYKLLNVSIIDIIRSKKKSMPFQQLIYTHPAIFMTEVALAKTLITYGIYPDYVFGSSLGEFAAMALSGIIDIEDCLRSIIQQAQILDASCSKGGMILVAESLSVFKQQMIESGLTLGVINSEHNYILSGNTYQINRFENWTRKQGILSFRLNVEYGFHSSAIESAKNKIIGLYDKISFSPPKTHYFSAVMEKEITTFNKHYCWDILRKQINAAAIIHRFILNHNFIFLDLSPTDTIANLLRQTNKALPIYNFFSPFGHENEKFSKNIVSLRCFG